MFERLQVFWKTTEPRRILYFDEMGFDIRDPWAQRFMVFRDEIPYGMAFDKYDGDAPGTTFGAGRGNVCDTSVALADLDIEAIVAIRARRVFKLDSDRVTSTHCFASISAG